jgi:hypothetical protein
MMFHTDAKTVIRMSLVVIPEMLATLSPANTANLMKKLHFLNTIPTISEFY